MVVLYELEEGSGTTVNDTSGVGVPLNLTVENAGAVSWVSGGLSITSSTIVESAGAATKIINSLMASNEISIEGWVKPANTSQSGPSRMVTLSANPSVRNFTLGQSGSYYNTRLRSTSTSVNGIPSLSTPSGSLTTALTHVVFTRDHPSGTTRMYINGSQVSSGNTPSSFSNWDQSFKFGLANELTMNRTWLGELHLVAIYSRELSASEVSQNFNAGPNGIYQTPTPTPTPVAVQAPTGMVAWWPGDGNTENLVSGGPDGILRNGATYAQGKVSQAFTLDGGNDHVEVANFGSFTVFSVDTWVFRNRGTASRESIVSYKEGNSPNCGFVLSLNEDGSSHRPRLWVQVNSQWKYAEGGASVPLSTWTFLTGTYDGQTIRMYVNGVEVDSTSASGAMTQCSQKTGIGSRASLNTHFFPGLIDEVEIFDRALSASEVQSIYTADSKGKVKPTATPTPTPAPVAGITVSPTSGLVTTEAGGTATFTVVLDNVPTADVTVVLSSSDTTEGTVSPASLTFTSLNWNSAHTVTVTGVDDAVVDGNIAYTIVTAAASSTDTNYNGLNPADVGVTNTDNDTAGVTVVTNLGAGDHRGRRHGYLYRGAGHPAQRRRDHWPEQL